MPRHTGQNPKKTTDPSQEQPSCLTALVDNLRHDASAGFLAQLVIAGGSRGGGTTFGGSGEKAGRHMAVARQLHPANAPRRIHPHPPKAWPASIPAHHCTRMQRPQAKAFEKKLLPTPR